MWSDECYTNDGHLVGMLDRDLRTAKTHQKDDYNRIQCHNTCGFAGGRFQAKNSARWCKKLSHHIRKTLQKFKQAAVVLLCLLYVVKIPFAASYPAQNMSDGQDQHDSKQDQRDMMRAIKDQASITMKVANFSFNQDFLNSSDSIPSVDGLVDQRVNFLFDRTNRLYGFPNASTTFDAGVMGTKMVENFEEFLLTFADCMSRFDSAFRILKDSKGKMVHHPTLVWTEIDAYISRFGTERLVKTEYTEDDFNDEKMDIPPDDQGKRWKAMVLVHRDFAMAATFFSQAMDYVYGVCVENDSRC